jgi:hypothetical protein
VTWRKVGSYTLWSFVGILDIRCTTNFVVCGISEYESSSSIGVPHTSCRSRCWEGGIMSFIGKCKVLGKNKESGTKYHLTMSNECQRYK